LRGKRLLPVADAFAGLLPDPGIRRGSVTVVTGSHALPLAVVAEASRTRLVGRGGWLEDLGILAAHELGLVLEQLALVSFPGRRWADTVATLLDAVDVVIVQPLAEAAPATRRRLAARAHECAAVLLPLGSWPEADLRLEIVRSFWFGLEQGHGRLQARQALVRVTGRGAAADTRPAWLWLPDDQGNVRAVQSRTDELRDCC
jgi:hypothetical protein